MSANDKPLVVHKKEATRMLELSLTSVDRAIARGDLKVKKHGKRSLLLSSEVERFLNDLPDQPKSKAKSTTRVG